MRRDADADFDQVQIKEELGKFINLLQSDYQANSRDSRSGHEYTLSKKLSVILSASEPESSSLDKENENPSANRSFETNQHVGDGNEQSLFQALMESGLNSSQSKMVQRLKTIFDQLKLENSRHLASLSSIQKELGAEKSANDQILTVLMKLDKQQKQLWNNYNILSSKYHEQVEKNKFTEANFKALESSIVALQNDNEFMKKLIFHANQNYEMLEKKCKDLQILKERSEANTDRKDMKKSSIDNFLKSAKTKKNGHSPSHSELQHSPRYEDFQEIYRKVILRTLKFKGKQPAIR